MVQQLFAAPASGARGMDRYRYFIFNQRGVVVLGILQMACAALCVVCGFMDAIFRKSTPLTATRAPMWGGLIMSCTGVLALFASQRKNPILVSVMMVSAVLSCVAAVIVSAYSCLTLTYGEDDAEVFHHHHGPEVSFVLHRTVKAANATILLSCVISLLLSSLIGYLGCRSLPLCACYDARTGLETLVPQSDPYPGTELVCTWQGGEARLAPAQLADRGTTKEEEALSKLPDDSSSSDRAMAF